MRMGSIHIHWNYLWATSEAFRSIYIRIACFPRPGYGMTPADVSTPDATVTTYHRIIEAFKFAYAKRTLLGDPNFGDTSTVGWFYSSSSFTANVVRKNLMFLVLCVCQSVSPQASLHVIGHMGPPYPTTWILGTPWTCSNLFILGLPPPSRLVQTCLLWDSLPPPYWQAASWPSAERPFL